MRSVDHTKNNLAQARSLDTRHKNIQRENLKTPNPYLQIKSREHFEKAKIKTIQSSANFV